MYNYEFHRECRTAYSEAYTVEEESRELGHIDLHYTIPTVHGTLFVMESITGEEIQELIDAIDEQLVMSSYPDRDDFIVAVYQGRDVGVYSAQDVDGEERV